MQQAPVMKSSGLTPINDEPVHVFGRNLEERVIESKEEEKSPEKKQEEADKKREQEDDLESIKRRKFDTVTGEEDEETSFQGDFKLFIWNKASSNWLEKGRGGTYRIILNVAIQHSFFKVISSTKTSIRFTDSLNVWAASGSNAKQLGDLIEERLIDAAKEVVTSSDLQGDEEATRGAEATGSGSESASSLSSETSRVEKDNGTSRNDEDRSDSPAQDQKRTTDEPSCSDGSNSATSDNPPEPNGTTSEENSSTTDSKHPSNHDDEKQGEQPEQMIQKKEPKEKKQETEEPEGRPVTEESEERNQDEEAKNTEDVEEQTERIKLGSS